MHESPTAYAGLYAQTYGREEPLAELIPAMLASFLQGDRNLIDADGKRDMRVGQAEGGAPTVEPIGVRIPDAMRMTGLSRSIIYQPIASGDIEAAKVGRSTVVPVASLRSLILARRKMPPRQA